MITLLTKFLGKKSSLKIALEILEQCAKDGDINVEQMLKLYKSHNFSPLQDNFSAFEHTDIIKCIKINSNKARNPSTSLTQGKRNAKGQNKQKAKTNRPL